MSSQIKNFYIRLLQTLAALYGGAFVGSILERALKSASMHTSLQFKDVWSDLVHIPMMLSTALFQNFSIPEKVIWIALYAICGVHIYRSNSKKWFPILVFVLTGFWVFYEANSISS